MIDKILILGAGRSAIFLIDYLDKLSQIKGLSIVLADQSPDLLTQRKKKFPKINTLALNIQDQKTTQKLIVENDLVISLLPASLQAQIAEYCLNANTHLLTASYLPAGIKAMEAKVLEKSLLFLNETGLDPGLDHMSACKMIHEIQAKGGEIKVFKSFAGALVSPEAEGDNPWKYKFTWNPRNVVLAGQGGTAKLIRNGLYKYIPYQQLFKRTQIIHIENLGDFEAYANRDSLTYREAYQLNNVPTIERGTLRRPGFCTAWNVLVQLGLTDDSYKMEKSAEMTWRQFLNAFLAYQPQNSLEERLKIQMQLNEEVFEQLKWLGLFENTKIGLKNVSPAQALQHLLEQKWSLHSEEQDMIVMQHQLDYMLEGEAFSLFSDLVVRGENAERTAIAKTVGLPLALAAEGLILGVIKKRGVLIPTEAEIYNFVLEKLKDFDISFSERTITSV